MRPILITTLLALTFYPSVAQRGVTDEMKETEEKLYASSKQINQFIHRFNGEEDEKGNRYYNGDKKYRDTGLRKKYLPTLFDGQAKNITKDEAEDFMDLVLDKRNPVYLDIHNGDWFAEVSTIFSYHGQSQPVLLYMRIQPQRKGYEWVIEDVAFEPFKQMFHKDTSDQKPFIHPMSHELDFMTLRKALQNNNNPESFTPDSFKPDFLTLFLYELKKKNLVFETVTRVKFHFFSVKGWYFELANFNRPGYNTGWLISNLMPIKEDQKQLLKDYLYDKL